MRIAYVEDEQIQAQLMLDYLNEYKQELLIDTFNSADEMIFKTNGSYPYDLVLLDIQMKGTSGMDLARKIREVDEEVVIVFLTAVKDYVFEGYEVNAFRYLLKPILKAQLFSLLDEISTKQKKNYFLITEDRTQYKLAYEDVLYVESDGHYVHVATSDKEYMLKENFNFFIQSFFQYDFIQTHRSYIVNLAYISRLEKDVCVLDNNKQIPISRNQKKIVMENFMSYFRGRM